MIRSLLNSTNLIAEPASSDNPLQSPGTALLRLAQKAATNGPEDLSRNIDTYLYEDA